MMGGVVSLLLTAAAATDHIELEPEPQGGMELIAMTTIAGCRMKQLDEEELSLNNKNDGPAFKFWMTGVAEVSWSIFVEQTNMELLSTNLHFSDNLYISSFLYREN